MAYRAIHDQGYKNDPLFGYNRVAFCGAGAATAFVLDKWVFHVHREKRNAQPAAYR